MKQSSTDLDAAETIEKLKARFGVDSDSDLALKLLVSRSTVANWRNRDRVPMRYIRIAQGEAVPSVFGGKYGEWPEVERAAMRLALMRMIRDFAGVGQSYDEFTLRGHEAASRLQEYHSKATEDLYRAMEERMSDDAHAVVQLIALGELSGRA